jgi:hypothetical protein
MAKNNGESKSVAKMAKMKSNNERIIISKNRRQRHGESGKTGANNGSENHQP